MRTAAAVTLTLFIAAWYSARHSPGTHQWRPRGQKSTGAGHSQTWTREASTREMWRGSQQVPVQDLQQSLLSPETPQQTYEVSQRRQEISLHILWERFQRHFRLEETHKNTHRWDQWSNVIKDEANSVIISGVRPYKCNLCEKSFTQRCSLESHCLKVHGVAHQYDYKQRRSKVMDIWWGELFLDWRCIQMYVCEDCGHTTPEPEVHYLHLKENHPYSPALLKFYDKRHFKFNNSNFASVLLQCSS